MRGLYTDFSIFTVRIINLEGKLLPLNNYEIFDFLIFENQILKS